MTTTGTTAPVARVLDTITDPRRRRRFEKYERFVRTYMEETAAAEGFDRWDAYLQWQRQQRDAALIHDDIAAVAAAAAALPKPFALPIGALLDPQAPLAPCPLDAAARSHLLAALLRRVLDPTLVPSFHDLDYLDDLPEILESRYCCVPAPPEAYPAAIRLIVWLTQGRSPLRDAVAATLQDHSILHPRRYTNNEDPAFRYEQREAGDVLGVDARADYDGYIRLNEQYSAARRRDVGPLDVRELSLFRGNERDHRAIARLIIDLIKRREVTAEDRVLVIGSRYRDEILFFREILGLPRTTGLDLVEDPGYIDRGDMHELPHADGTFRLVYCAGTLSYSYNARIAINEMARVATKPGVVIAIDAADRWGGTTALARTELSSAEALRRLFHRWDFQTLLCDEGRSMVPHFADHQDPGCYRGYPSVAVRIAGRR